MSQIIVFTRPETKLKPALEQWLKSHGAPCEPKKGGGAYMSELWIDTTDEVAQELFETLQGRAKSEPDDMKKDDLTGFYWAVFQEGTIWGRVYQAEKEMRSELIPLSARPRDILRYSREALEPVKQG